MKTLRYSLICIVLFCIAPILSITTLNGEDASKCIITNDNSLVSNSEKLYFEDISELVDDLVNDGEAVYCLEVQTNAQGTEYLNLPIYFDSRYTYDTTGSLFPISFLFEDIKIEIESYTISTWYDYDDSFLDDIEDDNVVKAQLLNAVGWDIEFFMEPELHISHKAFNNLNKKQKKISAVAIKKKLQTIQTFREDYNSLTSLANGISWREAEIERPIITWNFCNVILNGSDASLFAPGVLNDHSISIYNSVVQNYTHNVIKMHNKRPWSDFTLVRSVFQEVISLYSLRIYDARNIIMEDNTFIDSGAVLLRQHYSVVNQTFVYVSGNTHDGSLDLVSSGVGTNLTTSLNLLQESDYDTVINFLDTNQVIAAIFITQISKETDTQVYDNQVIASIFPVGIWIDRCLTPSFANFTESFYTLYTPFTPLQKVKYDNPDTVEGLWHSILWTWKPTAEFMSTEVVWCDTYVLNPTEFLNCQGVGTEIVAFSEVASFYSNDTTLIPSLLGYFTIPQLESTTHDAWCEVTQISQLQTQLDTCIFTTVVLRADAYDRAYQLNGITFSTPNRRLVSFDGAKILGYNHEINADGVVIQGITFIQPDDFRLQQPIFKISNTFVSILTDSVTFLNVALQGCDVCASSAGLELSGMPILSVYFSSFVRFYTSAIVFTGSYVSLISNNFKSDAGVSVFLSEITEFILYNNIWQNNYITSQTVMGQQIDIYNANLVMEIDDINVPLTGTWIFSNNQKTMNSEVICSVGLNSYTTFLIDIDQTTLQYITSQNATFSDNISSDSLLGIIFIMDDVYNAGTIDYELIWYMMQNNAFLLGFGSFCAYEVQSGNTVFNTTTLLDWGVIIPESNLTYANLEVLTFNLPTIESILFENLTHVDVTCWVEHDSEYISRSADIYPDAPLLPNITSLERRYRFENLTMALWFCPDNTPTTLAGNIIIDSSSKKGFYTTKAETVGYGSEFWWRYNWTMRSSDEEHPGIVYVPYSLLQLWSRNSTFTLQHLTLVSSNQLVNSPTLLQEVWWNYFPVISFTTRNTKFIGNWNSDQILAKSLFTGPLTLSECYFILRNDIVRNPPIFNPSLGLFDAQFFWFKSPDMDDDFVTHALQKYVSSTGNVYWGGGIGNGINNDITVLPFLFVREVLFWDISDNLFYNTFVDYDVSVVRVSAVGAKSLMDLSSLNTNSLVYKFESNAYLRQPDSLYTTNITTSGGVTIGVWLEGPFTPYEAKVNSWVFRNISMEDNEMYGVGAKFTGMSEDVLMLNVTGVTIVNPLSALATQDNCNVWGSSNDFIWIPTGLINTYHYISRITGYADEKLRVCSGNYSALFDPYYSDPDTDSCKCPTPQPAVCIVDADNVLYQESRHPYVGRWWFSTIKQALAACMANTRLIVIMKSEEPYQESLMFTSSDWHLISYDGAEIQVQQNQHAHVMASSDIILEGITFSSNMVAPQTYEEMKAYQTNKKHSKMSGDGFFSIFTTPSNDKTNVVSNITFESCTFKLKQESKISAFTGQWGEITIQNSNFIVMPSSVSTFDEWNGWSHMSKSDKANILDFYETRQTIYEVNLTEKLVSVFENQNIQGTVSLAQELESFTERSSSYKMVVPEQSSTIHLSVEKRFVFKNNVVLGFPLRALNITGSGEHGIQIERNYLLRDNTVTWKHEVDVQSNILENGVSGLYIQAGTSTNITGNIFDGYDKNLLANYTTDLEDSNTDLYGVSKLVFKSSQITDQPTRNYYSALWLSNLPMDTKTYNIHSNSLSNIPIGIRLTAPNSDMKFSWSMYYKLVQHNSGIKGWWYDMVGLDPQQDYLAQSDPQVWNQYLCDGPCTPLQWYYFIGGGTILILIGCFVICVVAQTTQRTRVRTFRSELLQKDIPVESSSRPHAQYGQVSWFGNLRARVIPTWLSDVLQKNWFVGRLRRQQHEDLEKEVDKEILKKRVQDLELIERRRKMEEIHNGAFKFVETPSFISRT